MQPNPYRSPESLSSGGPKKGWVLGPKPNPAKRRVFALLILVQVIGLSLVLFGKHVSYEVAFVLILVLTAALLSAFIIRLRPG